MNTYSFTEATPLLKFIEENKKYFIGSELKYLHVEYWPELGRRSLTDIPIVLEFENYCIVVNYLIYSDMELIIGKREELLKDQDFECSLNIRNHMQDYYSEEFELGIKKELIENCKIVGIQVDRFSEAFECDGATGEMRPDGGDYFSTIRFCLDSGVVLCICGVDSITDGYVEVWCE